MEPLTKDYELWYRSQWAASGALVHRINNARGRYLNAIEMANQALEKGDTERYEKYKADVERYENELRILVSRAGA